MAAIAVEQGQYKTYVLSDETSRSRVEIVPERGGIITRWQMGDQEIFYLDQERFTDPNLSVRGGNPILFPICGNLVDNSYTYEGQTYTLKQHGFAREMPWQVQEPVGDRLTLTLESTEQTRAVYPFEFQLIFTYALQGNLLMTQQRIANLSQTAMPCAIGFHPYFSVQDKTQLEFELPVSEFTAKQTQITEPFAGQFDFEQDEIDLASSQLSSSISRVIDRQRGLRLTLESSDTFSTLVFWTQKGKDFYCLEPWSAPRNALNTGEHLFVLQPGTSVETMVNLSVESL
jgi:galactose mutarotase-like enzyme